MPRAPRTKQSMQRQHRFPKKRGDATIKEGEDRFPGVISYMREHTTYYPPHGQASLWESSPENDGDHDTNVLIRNENCADAARLLAERHPGMKVGIVAVYKPGRRSSDDLTLRSTLKLSLSTPAARRFYLDQSASQKYFNSDCILYSPQVVLFKDEHGEDHLPLQADVITVAQVNPKHIRKQRHEITDAMHLENSDIREALRERLGRVLWAFEKHGVELVCLPIMSTRDEHGLVDPLVMTWFRLLVAPGARFGKSFKEVIVGLPKNEAKPWRFSAWEESFRTRKWVRPGTFLKRTRRLKGGEAGIGHSDEAEAEVESEDIV